MSTHWTISSNGIGDFSLGESPTAEGVSGASPFEAFIADGIEVKGWEMARPKLRIELNEGGKINALRLYGKAPQTQAGLGVGSTLKALQNAYPDLRTRNLPPTLGKDRCSATTRTLPDVRFHFESCEAAESGAEVIRVDLWRD